MKYFYYISKPKVQMLAAQARKSRFSLKSITSKLGFGPASITASVEQQPDSLVSDTVSLLDHLENAKTIRPSSDLSNRCANGFFQDRGRWHHGLFGFRTVHPFVGDFRGEPSATVVYALWRELGTSALILLIGSPNNLLGEKIVSSESVIVPGSLSAQSMIIRYVEAFVNADEPVAVHLGLEKTCEHNGCVVSEPSISQIILPEGCGEDDEMQKESMQLPPLRPEERGLGLACFCLRELSRLDEATLDTVFRVFSSCEIPTEDKADRFRFSGLGSVERARELGVLNFRTVFVGSPVYTALE